VLYVTHDQEEALAVSDHVIVMEGGRIAQKGTPAELYEAPASRFLADFIGDANLVEGEVALIDGGTRFTAGNVSVTLPAKGVPPGPATLAVRPHGLRITAPGAGLLTAECRRVAYLGSRIEYVVATPWGELLVFDAPSGAPLARGDAAGVAFDPRAAVVLPQRTAP
jgi:iron(III) transport system ATP-binding protein